MMESWLVVGKGPSQVVPLDEVEPVVSEPLSEELITLLRNEGYTQTEDELKQFLALPLDQLISKLVKGHFPSYSQIQILLMSQDVWECSEICKRYESALDAIALNTERLNQLLLNLSPEKNELVINTLWIHLPSKIQTKLDFFHVMPYLSEPHFVSVCKAIGWKLPQILSLEDVYEFQIGLLSTKSMEDNQQLTLSVKKCRILQEIYFMFLYQDLLSQFIEINSERIRTSQLNRLMIFHHAVMGFFNEPFSEQRYDELKESAKVYFISARTCLRQLEEESKRQSLPALPGCISLYFLFKPPKKRNLSAEDEAFFASKHASLEATEQFVEHILPLK